MNPNFEKYIRESLKDQEDFVDAAAIWEQVEPHVQPEKKRRRFFWWFFFGAGVLALSAGLWIYSAEENPLVEDFADKKELPHSQLSSTQRLSKRNLQETIDNNNNTNLNKNKEQQKTNQQNELLTNQVIENPEQPIVTLDSPLDNEISEISPKNSRSTEVEKKDGLSPDPLVPDETLDATSYVEYLQDGSYEPLSEEPRSSMVVAPFEEKGIEEEFVNELLKANHTNLYLPSLTDEIVIGEMENDRQDEELIPEGVKPIIPVHKERNWKFAFGLHAGLGKVKSEWSMNGEDREEGGYFTNRNTTEKQLESSVLGLSITAQRKKFSFRTGLEYQRIARRFNYEENISTHDTISDAILKIYVNTTTGDTILDRGELINTRTESYEKEVYNYFHRLDIPLFVGYRFKKGRFLLGLEAGVFANVLLQKKGAIVSQTADRSFYDLNKDESKWYRTNLGVTPALQMNLGYEFAPGIDVYLSPNYRFKTTYSTSANLVKEQYSSLGIQVGLKYWIR